MGWVTNAPMAMDSHRGSGGSDSGHSDRGTSERALGHVMPDKIDGVGIGAVVAGTIFVYSGITGRSVLASIQAMITGKAPSSVPNTAQIAGQDSGSVSAGTTAAISPSGMANPIGKGLVRGRTDEGVDFSGAGDLYAMGPGVIENVYSNWPGGVYILLHLDSGQYIYYAENITPSVTKGQRVTAGQKIGHANGSSPFIEIGFGTSVPGVAAASSHYTEGEVTAEGQQMASLLTSLGAP